MLNTQLNSVTWTSDLSKEDAKRIVRSKASALGWRGRNTRHVRNKSQQEPADQTHPHIRHRRMSLIPIPPPVTVYEPQSRLLPTFIPRFESLLGIDAKQILLQAGDELLHDAIDCLVVGVCGNITFDTELRRSAVERYGVLLPKIQARVNSLQKAETSTTLSLIFLLGIQEALVWKSFRNSQTHIIGWGRVVEICGPEFFSSPDTIFGFRMYRMNAVTLHLRLRKRLFLASEEWMTIPWFCTIKDLFDRAYDLLVQIPDLLADVEDVKLGQLAPVQMHANVAKFIGAILRWKSSALFPAAATFVPTEAEWTIEKIVAYIEDGTISDYTFARGLTHYFAVMLLISQFGQRCVESMPLKPEVAIRSIVSVVRIQSLYNDQGALWPWFVPLRVAHFTTFAREVPELVFLCEQLEEKYSWPILNSERYKLYAQQKQ